MTAAQWTADALMKAFLLGFAAGVTLMAVVVANALLKKRGAL